MKIGFLTNALVEQARRSGLNTFQTLDEVAAWAADHGFTDLECGPMLPLDRAAYERVLGEGRIAITALIYCRNYLSTDPEEAATHLAELKKRIEFAGALGIERGKQAAIEGWGEKKLQKYIAKKQKLEAEKKG